MQISILTHSCEYEDHRVEVLSTVDLSVPVACRRHHIPLQVVLEVTSSVLDRLLLLQAEAQELHVEQPMRGFSARPAVAHRAHGVRPLEDQVHRCLLRHNDSRTRMMPLVVLVKYALSQMLTKWRTSQMTKTRMTKVKICLAKPWKSESIFHLNNHIVQD